MIKKEQMAQSKSVAHSKADIVEEQRLTAAMQIKDAKLPKFSTVEGGSCRVDVPDVRTYSQIFGGSNSLEFADAMMTGCGNVSGKAVGSERDKAHALAIVAEIAPQDGLEAMLATQMAAVHIATIRESRLLASSNNLQQLDAHEKAFNKLTRTFAAQLETLRKYRNGGKQIVTVQHVNVEDGGQAIVGNVETGGGK